MSIVDSTNSKRDRRMARVKGVACAATLVSTAIFAAAPKVARGDWCYQGTGDGNSWFNTANWVCADPNSTTTVTTVTAKKTTLTIGLPYTLTGTLPDTITNPVTNIDAANTSMPNVGVLFDPANQGFGAGYVANFDRRATSFYVSSASANSQDGGADSQPNKLTIQSGTMNFYLVSLGRDGQGMVVQNGGTWIGNASLNLGGDNKTINGTGTYEYHGGVLINNNQVKMGAAQTSNGPGSMSAAVGVFTVYNDGPDGYILNENGMSVGFNSQTGGATGIVNFHYDLNTHGIGNTRPIQNVGGGTANNGNLNIRNVPGVLFHSDLGQSDDQTSWQSGMNARLNLVLDAAPSMINGSVQNLGLFKDNQISGFSTWPKIFYSLDGTKAYSQGSTVTATDPGGTTYSWTISYQGLITWNNGNSTGSSADSSYTGTNIAATGGNDVVLIEIAAVPEPASLALLGGAGSLMLARRRSKKA